MEHNRRYIAYLKSLFKDPNTVFFAICISGLCISSFVIYFTNGRCLDNFLFSFNDRFMDFYNSARNAKMDNPYEQIKAIYPPLVFCILKFFTFSIPNETIFMEVYDYTDTDYSSLIFIRESRGALFSIISFYVICFLLLYSFVKRVYMKNIKIFMGIICTSYTFLYCIDRGNIAILAMIFLLGFSVYENSDNMLYRELSLIFLSFSINLKIYPVLIAFILLSEKKITSFIKTTIYSALLFFIPFFKYGGLKSFILLLDNIFYETSKIGVEYVNSNFNIVSFLTNVALVFKISPNFGDKISKIIPASILILGIILLFFLKKRWKKYLLVICIMLLVPSTTASYNGIFYIIPLIMYLNAEKDSYDFIYASLLGGCFVSISLCFQYNYYFYNISFILLSISTVVMTILLFVESLLNIFIHMKGIKNKWKLKNPSKFF